MTGRWTADGAEVVVGSRQATDGRREVILLPEADRAALRSQRVLPPGEFAALVVRHEASYARVPVRDSDGRERSVLVDVATLMAIVADVVPDSAPLALLSCRAGAVSDGFAQRVLDARVAQAGGTAVGDVLAAVDDLYVGSRGRRGDVVTVEGRSWQLLTPLDREAWDVVNDEVGDEVVRPFDGISAVDVDGPDVGVHLGSGAEGVVGRLGDTQSAAPGTMPDPELELTSAQAFDRWRAADRVLGDLRRGFDDAQGRRNEAERLHGEAEEQRRRLEGELDDVRRTVAALNGELGGLESTLSEQAAEVKRLADELVVARDGAGVVATDLAIAKQHAERTAEAANKAEQEATAAREALELFDRGPAGEGERGVPDRAELVRRADERARAAQALRERLTEAQEKVRGQADALDRLTETAGRLERDHSQATAALEGIRERIGTVTSQRDDARIRVDALAGPAAAARETAAERAEHQALAEAAWNDAQRRVDGQHTVVQRWQARREAQADLTDPRNGLLHLGASMQRSTIVPDTLRNEVRQLVDDHWGDHPPAVDVREQILREIDELLTGEALTSDLPTLVTDSGSAHIVGDDGQALRLTLWAELSRPDDQPAAPTVPADGLRLDNVEGEVKAAYNEAVNDDHSTHNVRNLPLFYRQTRGMGDLPWLRVVAPFGGARFTVNEFRRSATVEQGVGHGYVMRTREPHHPHTYKVTWRVQVTSVHPDVVRPAVTSRPPLPDPNTLTLWFPEHLARPRGAVVDLEESEGSVRSPQILLDGLDDPGAIERELRQRLWVGGERPLERLSATSQKHLLDFLSERNLKGGFSKLHRQGLISKPLYDRRGTFLGVLRLRATITPRRRVTLTDNTSMESIHVNKVRTSGTAGLWNATELTAGVGVAMISNPIEDTIEPGTYTMGGVQTAVTGGTASGHLLNAGSSTALGKGWKSSSDPERPGRLKRAWLAQSDIEWTVTLLADAGVDDANAPSTTWHGRTAAGEGARVRYVPTTITPPAPGDSPTFAPAWLAHGGGMGLATLDEFALSPLVSDGNDIGVDAEVRRRLAEEGFLPTGTGLLSAVTGGALGDTNHQQVRNFVNLLTVTSDDFRMANWDELESEGLWVAFDRSTATGANRVLVRWTVSGEAVGHEGTTTDLTVWNAVEASNELTHTHQERDFAAVDPPQPVVVLGLGEGTPVRTVPVSVGPYRHTRHVSSERTSGASLGREVVTIGPGDEPSQVFRRRFRLTAEMYRVGDNDPFWRYENRDPVTGAETPNAQPGSVRAWVPDFLTSDSPTAAPDSPAPRPVEDADLRGLQRQGEQRFGPLPGITRAGGSTQLNRAFQEMFQEVFGDAPSRAGKTLSGASPVNEASASAQLRRAFVSPTKLRAEIDEILGGKVYSSDDLFEDGAASGREGSLTLRFYPSEVQYQQSRRGNLPDFYHEDSTTTASGVTRAQAVGRGHLGALGVGLPFSIAGPWRLGVPAALWGSRMRSAIGAESNTSLKQNIPTYNGPVHTLRMSGTYVARLVGADRNLAGNIVEAGGGNRSRMASRAVDVPDTIEAHVDFRELFDVWRAMQRAGSPIRGLPEQVERDLQARLRQVEEDERVARAIAGHTALVPPPTGPDVRYPPRRIVERLGLGDATVRNVKETGPAGGLYELAMTAVEKAVPGATRPGSNTYLPGLHQQLTVLVSRGMLRTAAARYFSTGEDPEPAVAWVPFVTTQHGGAIMGRIVLKAAPAVGYQATPGSSQALRSIFGRPSGNAGMEDHEQAGHGTKRGDGVVWSGGIRAGVGYTRSGMQLSLRSPAAFADLSAARRSARNSGDRHDRKNVVKSSGAMVPFDIPMRFTIEVLTRPMEASPRNAVGPLAVEAVVGAVGTVASWLGWNRPHQPPTFADVVATVEVPEGDTSPRPLLAEPPAWYRRPSRFHADSRTEPAVTGAPGRFTERDVMAWQRPDDQTLGGLPPESKLSWINDEGELATLAKQTLPGIASSFTGSSEIDEYFVGVTGLTNLQAAFEPAGARRTFTGTGWTGLTTIEADLTVKVIGMTGWKPSTDRMVGGDGAAEEFVVGAHTNPIVEHHRSSAGAASISGGSEGHVTATAAPGLYSLIDDAVVAKGLKNAPGNLRLGQLNAFAVTVGPGEAAGTSAASKNADSRAVRLPHSPGGSASGQPAGLVYSYVLLEITGTTRWRYRPSSTWRVGESKRRRLAVVVEARLPQSGARQGVGELADPPDRPTGEAGRRERGQVEAAAARHDLRERERTATVTDRDAGTTRADGLTGRTVTDGRLDDSDVRAAGPHGALAGPVEAPVVAWNLVLPPGVASHGDVRVVAGAGNDERLRMLPRVAEVARDVGAPVVLVDVGGDAAGRSDVLRTLNALLERYRWRRERPVVISTSGAPQDVIGVVGRQGVALVYRAAGQAAGDGLAALNNVWVVRGPDGVLEWFGDNLTSALLNTAAGKAQPVSEVPPTELADWLAAEDWVESRRLLDEHGGVLAGGESRAALRDMLTRSDDRALTAREIVLDLAQSEPVDLAEFTGDELARLVLGVRDRLSPSVVDRLADSDLGGPVAGVLASVTERDLVKADKDGLARLAKGLLTMLAGGVFTKPAGEGVFAEVDEGRFAELTGRADAAGSFLLSMTDLVYAYLMHPRAGHRVGDLFAPLLAGRAAPVAQIVSLLQATSSGTADDAAAAILSAVGQVGGRLWTGDELTQAIADRLREIKDCLNGADRMEWVGRLDSVRERLSVDASRSEQERADYEAALNEIIRIVVDCA
ncbi:hypothetical protein [Micromonospora thermarum]|uniref:Uncharacterized protein n=1 Tax=Micromonospora thermarum TaxID=2720024 RepID=A0ABX0Z4P8_9ACTN|nr:hypothetical protein [Micromonospora thermarum]NJP31949.1 hypothetical protein [Micromonospora thermarum]